MSESLFDVPRNKTRLELAKEQHQIQTHHNADCDPPWIAVLVEKARALDPDLPKDAGIGRIFGAVGEMVDEAGLSGYGNTEVEAVLAVCRRNNIAVIL